MAGQLITYTLAAIYTGWMLMMLSVFDSTESDLIEKGYSEVRVTSALLLVLAAQLFGAYAIIKLIF